MTDDTDEFGEPRPVVRVHDVGFGTYYVVEDRWRGRYERRCGVCSELLQEEHCKLVCRSTKCRYRIIETCNE